MNAGPAPIADAREREVAVDPSRSFIVQAPAGSGKTELLIQRFLALLGSVRRPEEILAITFTRKAAGEMRSRLLKALEMAEENRPAAAHEARTWELARKALERDRENGWHLAETPSLLTIQTIDSFNASLVRRMPWVSRFGAMPKVCEDPEPLYRQAAERTLAELGSGGRGGAEVATVLSHLDNRMDLFRDLLVSMLRRRDQWLRHLGKKEHALWRQSLEGSLRSLVEGRLGELAGTIPADLRDELIQLARYAATRLPGGERPLASLDGLETFPGRSSEDLPCWKGLADLLLTAGDALRKRLDRNCGFPPGKGEATSMKERMKELLDRLSATPRAESLLGEIRRLPPTAYPDDQWQILQALVDLLPLAAAQLWLVFREEGGADFAAIAMGALDSLSAAGDPSELLLMLDARINHLLVDEFQDTSWLQFQLLENLTAGWSPGDGRTLFLVGDPMQSIYLFREAEVGLFLRARQRGIGSVALEALTLSSNFRSQEGIVSWVNRTFADLFPDREDEALGGIVYSPASAVHGRLEGPSCCVHPFSDRDDFAEGQQVAALARRALEGDSAGTVAVLVRGRTHLPEILMALKEEGLRYSAKDIDLLGCRPAVRDILALTRALLHPADRLSWLSVLRAPWCGLLLRDLYALCGEEPSQTVPALLRDPEAKSRLSEDGRERAERVQGILSLGVARRGAVGLRRLVEGCWLALGGPACSGSGSAKDVEMVFSLMEKLDHGGDLLSLDGLEESVKKLFAASDSGADGRLQVMTIHKSKGLEFDTVILPGLGRPPAGGDKPLMRWLEHPDSGLLLAPVSPRDGSAKDPIYEAIGRLEREKEDLEVTRLLYVAATRARKRLHLLGHAKLNGKGEFSPSSGSLLKKLWPAVESRFASADAPDNPSDSKEEGRGGSRIFRLPCDWAMPQLVPARIQVGGAVSQPSDRREADLRGDPFSGWEAETARHVGTVSHAYLERIAREGLGRWSAERVRGDETAIARRLNALGVPASEIPSGVRKVVDALCTALASTRGRWILGDRSDAESESALSGMVDGQLVHAVIDRTFVDDDGVRWVIDYKTTPCPEKGQEAFLREQGTIYAGQLAAYGALFRSLELGRTIRTALYFPLFDGWWEVA
ncbi:MAG: DNA helicase UvrD [Desulfuromonas sp.]|uniref:UvrD-helicase domain-containing protein n=1 Tax=Desulfuromonas sp. TaxID=892 RepID=UPI000CBBB8B4|nr:UvrD-helicase domain-containing protein [Desulfuromonas sp.]PLX81921.1 MAG: DNA helicase UvrD [Desulfuromonas sp.]